MFLPSRAIVALCGLLAVSTALTASAEAGCFPMMYSGAMFGFRRRACCGTVYRPVYGGACYGGGCSTSMYGGGFYGGSAYGGGCSSCGGGGCGSCGVQSYYAPSYGYGMGGCSSCGSCGSCGISNYGSYYGSTFGCGSCGNCGGNCGVYGCAGGNCGTGNCGTGNCANGNCGVVGANGQSDCSPNASPQNMQPQKVPVNPAAREPSKADVEPNGYNGRGEANSQLNTPEPTLKSAPKTPAIPRDDEDTSPTTRIPQDEGFQPPTKTGPGGSADRDGESIEANKFKAAKPAAVEPAPLDENKDTQDNKDGASYQDELEHNRVNRPLPKINVDDKVAWKSTATKVRLSVTPSVNTARLARVVSYPHSGWVATKSQPEAATVAKK